jgi:hypothetical protein
VTAIAQDPIRLKEIGAKIKIHPTTYPEKNGVAVGIKA